MLSAKQTKSDWSAATKPFIAEFSFVVFETHFGLGYFRVGRLKKVRVRFRS